MTTLTTRTAVSLLVAVMAVGVTAEPQSPAVPGLTEDDLFSENTIQDISLTVNTRDWNDLREKYTENTYYLADLRWRGLTVRNVGIRSRGNASRSATKPGLRVDFDRYSLSQEFLGFKSLVLDNMVQDPAMLRERVAMKFFREMGLPAPRVVHARLMVNNKFLGLYTIVEPIDKRFLKRAVGENDGYLYEFKGTAQNYGLSYLGEELEPYAALFEPKTRETASMFDLYRPIKELTFAVERSPGYRFVETTAEFLDLRKFLTYVAIEAFLAERDGILGEWGMNNFYLYRFEKGMRFQLLPWDRDTALFDLGLSVYNRIEFNVLMRRLMEDAEMRRFYEDELRRCAEVAMRPDGEDPATVQPGWLVREIRTAYLQIRALARQDPNTPFSVDEFEAAIEKVLDLASRRSTTVLEDLDRGYGSAAGR
jgi:spore coat protein CotH